MVQNCSQATWARWARPGAQKSTPKYVFQKDAGRNSMQISVIDSSNGPGNVKLWPKPILDQKWLMSSKTKNSQCGEVRSKKFFQILKKLIKTRPVMYFSPQTDNTSMRTTRITDFQNSRRLVESLRRKPG